MLCMVKYFITAYSTIRYGTQLKGALLYCQVPYVRHFTIMYGTLLYGALLCGIVLYYLNNKFGISITLNYISILSTWMIILKRQK